MSNQFTQRIFDDIEHQFIENVLRIIEEARQGGLSDPVISDLLSEIGRSLETTKKISNIKKSK